MEDGKCGKFNDEEVNLLMILVEKYKDTIENKKTDAVMWKQKQRVWELLTQEFNAVNGSHRYTKNIRCKYENLKKTAKKKFALEKNNIYKTGGGVDPPVPITNVDEKIKTLISVSLEGLENPGDGDRKDEVVPEPDQQQPSTSHAWSGWSPAALKTPASTSLDVTSEEATGNLPLSDETTPVAWARFEQPTPSTSLTSSRRTGSK